MDSLKHIYFLNNYLLSDNMNFDLAKDWQIFGNINYLIIDNINRVTKRRAIDVQRVQYFDHDMTMISMISIKLFKL